MAAVSVIQSSRTPSDINSESRKRKMAPSPRGANLDILLGLGDDDASESEGEYSSLKKTTTSGCEQKLPTEYVPVNTSNENANTTVPEKQNDLSTRISDMLFSPKFKQRPKNLAAKRGKGVQRVVIERAEMASDDEESMPNTSIITANHTIIATHPVIPVISDVTMEVTNDVTSEGTIESIHDFSNQVINEITREVDDVTATVMDSVPTSVSIASMDLGLPSLESVESKMDLGPRSVESMKSLKSSKSSAPIGNRATVSFADDSECIESIFEGDVDGVVDSLRITTLSSACRRSRRLSGSSVNSSLTNNSVTKCKRRGTPHAPRFSRPSSRESSSSCSGGSKGSMDVMREDCGYGSYFSSMESADKVSTQHCIICIDLSVCPCIN